MQNKASIIAASVGATCLVVFTFHYFSPEQRMLRNLRRGFEQLEKEKKIANKKYAEAQKVKKAEDDQLSRKAKAYGLLFQYCVPETPCNDTQSGINIFWNDPSASISYVYDNFGDKTQVKCNEDGSVETRNYTFWSKEGDGNQGWSAWDKTCQIDREADGTPSSLKIFMNNGSHLLSEVKM